MASKGKSRTNTGRGGRRASEQAILDAFERLFLRHGANGVGVNAVLSDAKVGKRLLYEYFGSLEGLAEAWSEQGDDPIALGERRKALLDRARKLPPGRRTSLLLGDYASALRDHPWATSVLLAELQRGNGVARAMRDIRKRMGDDYEGLMLEAGTTAADEQAMSTNFILHAATTYLALRARFAPDYNGINLATPEGWAAAMSMLGTVAAATDGAPTPPDRSPGSGAAPKRRAPPAKRKAKPRA